VTLNLLQAVEDYVGEIQQLQSNPNRDKTRNRRTVEILCAIENRRARRRQRPDDYKPRLQPGF
jgi:hypothetical protein